MRARGQAVHHEEEEEGADRSGLGMDLDLDLDVDLMADLDLMQAGLRQLVICCALYERQRSATLAISLLPSGR